MIPEEQTLRASDAELRKRALERLRKQAGFRVHLVVYLAVNALLVVIWFVTDARVFWPIFAILGWGIGIVANGWDAYPPDPITEHRIQAELDRLRRR